MKIILPWPQPARKAIVPIFLPFMGCRTRCVFCAQDRQTGLDHVRNLRELRERLLKAEAELELFRQKHGKVN